MARNRNVVSPLRGEIWAVNLDPTVGHEQAGLRPALVVSSDALNSAAWSLVVVLPITGTDRGFPSHVKLSPPEGGLTKPSVIMVEQPRTVSKSRLGRRFGIVSPETMEQVDELLRMVLDL
jgi:mRNA interferase MazF